MISTSNLAALLQKLDFEETQQVYSKHFTEGDFYLKVDFNKQELIYPEDKGFKINERQTCNFSLPENFVVFECVYRLLMKGYKPEHIELEPKWKLGHGAGGGRADILVRNQQNKPLLIIECKTAGKEFDKAWKDTQIDGAQLFSYIEQEKDVEFVCLYAANFDEKTNTYNDFQRIISHKDNEKILADDAKLKGFAAAKNVKERYKVWKETYQLEYTEKGIFEENIQAYQIGKDKYTLDIDTKTIDTTDIKGKYHQFRTILRKYNVSRRENAFEVLVNLFLCKLVDEIENPNDLKFYWKGIAYDNYFDLVDRLQELYKMGMDKFLHQDIVYISNKEIDDAFWAMKQKRNATKTQIKELFKTLKFYNSNDFGFVSVRNAEAFNKNAKILLEIIQMWQGLRLKTKEQNQFLGDMFEFFLDNGIKQSEGQFFTPVPICKFIVMSLPLENKIQQSGTALRAMDYACGSGHFLTEYALQIKPLVKQYKQAEPSEYYKNIYGIEKEDRLAKVAKVSAFMYGRDEINVLDADALATNPDVKNESFDLLIANPPFAVEDFLMTLDEADRDKYELSQTVNDLGNNGIECFFIERAKQLLQGNGVAGLIVHSSVLTNAKEKLYIQTREILLKYFDFISIVELGSNTFGKTGTNTVVLFLRRKAQRPEPAEHYWNRTLDFFENWDDELKSGGGAYLDIDTVRQYCQHIDIPFDEYQTLLQAKPSAQLLETEMFKDYKADFDNLNDTKKLKEAKQHKAKTKAEQEAELHKRFVKYLQTIEQQKLYYFILAQSNPQPVLLIKSPADNKEQKQFLGYEWSGSKGSEGIKYNGGDTIHQIITPMFDPKDRQNNQKISYYIRQNFMGRDLAPQGLNEIPEHLQPYMTQAHLVDLLDFSRKDFNKAFSLTPKNMKPIATKWDLIKISDAFLEIKNGKSVKQFDEVGKFKVSRIESIAKGIFNEQAIKWTNDDVKEQDFLQKGDILFSHINSVAHLGKTAIFNLDEKIVHGINLLKFRPNQTILLPAYAAEIFKLDDFTNEIKNQAQKAINQASVNTSYLNELKIPLPPLDVQQQIVAKCEAIDTAVSNAKIRIETARAGIEEKVRGVFDKADNDKIENLSSLLKRGKSTKYGSSNIQVIKSGQARGYTSFDFKEKFYTDDNFVLDERQLKNGDLLINSTGVGTAGRVTLFELDGNFVADSHITIFRTNKKVLPKFALYCLAYIGFKSIEKMAKGATGQIELTISIIGSIKIPVPPLAVQAALVSEIAVLEQQIAAYQAIINEAAGQKQAVMQKYL